jgi:hypothetical protein
MLTRLFRHFLAATIVPFYLLSYLARLILRAMPIQAGDAAAACGASGRPAGAR